MVALALLTGLVTGMLVNLCADALSANVRPAKEPGRFSIGAPVCAACGRERPLLARSALLAYLTGRRRCPSCAAPLPVRYLLVELAMIVLHVLIWTPPGTSEQAGAVTTRVLQLLYSAILTLVLVTDLEHRLVPHAVMLPALIVAALAAFINPSWDSPLRALLGGAVGLLCGLALYGGGILFAQLLGRIRGRPIAETAFGFGDVTLITFIGLIVGAPQVLLALAIGVLSAGLFALLYLLYGLVQRRYTLFTAIPYAPFLILGGAAMLAFGQEIMAWYL